MYIVWNPKSNLPPTVQHSTRQKAISVAGAMASKEPGHEFFVCKLVTKAQKPVPVEVNYTDLEKAPASCPF